MELKHLQFNSPFTMMVAGPSGGAKTVLVRRILKNHRLLIAPHNSTLSVIWAYGQWQATYNEPVENVRIQYVDGLPSQVMLQESHPNVIIIDDLMNELADNVRMGNLFTKGSHHMNINVIFISQNLYHKGKQMRNINLSCHYLILMKNPRDRSQIDVLARQMKLNKALPEAFNDATSKPFGYLLVDLKQDTPANCMLRTRITPEETVKGVFSPIVYEQK